jgi:hypothetical protein
MRFILSVAAAAALCAMSANLASAAEPLHTAGGPLQESGMCWVSTNNDLGYGYWKTCEPMAAGMTRHKKKM